MFATRGACDAGCERGIIVRMSMGRILLSAFVLGALSACSSKPDVDAASAPALSAMAHALMARQSTSTAVEYAPAPAGIFDLLDLEQVRIHPDGVYFQTDSGFVQEDGVFVPRNPATFVPPAAGDPSYTHVALDVFIYHIAG